MIRLALVFLGCLAAVSAFHPSPILTSRCVTTTQLASSKSSDDPPPQQQAFPVGTFVNSKKRGVLILVKSPTSSTRARAEPATESWTPKARFLMWPIRLSRTPCLVPLPRHQPKSCFKNFREPKIPRWTQFSKNWTCPRNSWKWLGKKRLKEKNRMIIW